jgi:hypothetical protein
MSSLGAPRLDKGRAVADHRRASDTAGSQVRGVAAAEADHGDGHPMKRFRLLLLLPALACCSLVTVADRYGNRYGDWYNHGSQYAWQLSFCENTLDAQQVAPDQRKLAMRCCMGRNGVPIDDAQSCHATG